MTILWCGGEDIDFNNSSAISMASSYSGDTARLTYSRGVPNCGGLYHYGIPILQSPVTSIWLSFYGRFNPSGTNMRFQMCGIVDAITSKGFWVGVATNNQSLLAINKYDGSSITTLAYENISSISLNVYKYDLQMINYGSNATINLYLNGELAAAYTGDISIPGITSFNAVGIKVDLSYTCVSEIIMADEDTRAMSLKTIAPSASGDSNTFTGTYADLDDVTVSDIDYVNANANAQQLLFNNSDLVSTICTVKAVKTSYRAIDNSTTLKLQAGIKSGETTYLEDQTVDSYWENKEIIYQVNPITGVAFTPEEINALQIAYKTVSI